eukprot:2066608-Amphidinium_carterae.2
MQELLSAVHAIAGCLNRLKVNARPQPSPPSSHLHPHLQHPQSAFLACSTPLESRFKRACPLGPSQPIGVPSTGGRAHASALSEASALLNMPNAQVTPDAERQPQVGRERRVEQTVEAAVDSGANMNSASRKAHRRI